ncbi:hypothetical protein BDK51DRAFT_34010 [Blyttiomyces helicus]|uniref:Uncharacterized protein n=1 Tax=Blyttiomyces helicus TaxID=388810 RepID=A0A4P9VYL9_9FUNG|nr:hypothetical protein BDK51DRAFT_34010 [Blyttiomyces helicus]|eukprot:RKO84889.1 hypothetical protein BDK51DRAFT_34010 [Blyttiomyces helicus]
MTEALNEGSPHSSTHVRDTGSEGGREMAAMLAENSTLKTLILRGSWLLLIGGLSSAQTKTGNKLGDPEAVHFGAGLKANSTLTVLDLSNNEIGDLGAIALGNDLNSNESLKTLNLGWNQIRNKGLAGFFLGMKVHNGIGDGGQPLAQFISKNIALFQILPSAPENIPPHTSNTRCSDAAMSMIGKSLEQNCEESRLSHYAVEGRGSGLRMRPLTALTHSSARSNTHTCLYSPHSAHRLTSDSLRELHCSDNPFTNAGAITLFKSITMGNNLTSLYIKVPLSQYFGLKRVGRWFLARGGYQSTKTPDPSHPL